MRTCAATFAHASACTHVLACSSLHMAATANMDVRTRHTDMRSYRYTNTQTCTSHCISHTYAHTHCTLVAIRNTSARAHALEDAQTCTCTRKKEMNISCAQKHKRRCQLGDTSAHVATHTRALACTTCQVRRMQRHKRACLSAKQARTYTHIVARHRYTNTHARSQTTRTCTYVHVCVHVRACYRACMCVCAMCLLARALLHNRRSVGATVARTLLAQLRVRAQRQLQATPLPANDVRA